MMGLLASVTTQVDNIKDLILMVFIIYLYCAIIILIGVAKRVFVWIWIIVLFPITLPMIVIFYGITNKYSHKIFIPVNIYQRIIEQNRVDRGFVNNRQFIHVRQPEVNILVEEAIALMEKYWNTNYQKSDIDNTSGCVCLIEFNLDEKLIQLHGSSPYKGHMFHSEGIQAWAKTHETGPLCRKNFISILKKEKATGDLYKK